MLARWMRGGDDMEHNRKRDRSQQQQQQKVEYFMNSQLVSWLTNGNHILSRVY